jgi:hypothetical protein
MPQGTNIHEPHIGRVPEMGFALRMGYCYFLTLAADAVCVAGSVGGPGGSLVTE